eukprot:gene23312-30552_t
MAGSGADDPLLVATPASASQLATAWKPPTTSTPPSVSAANTVGKPPTTSAPACASKPDTAGKPTTTITPPSAAVTSAKGKSPKTNTPIASSPAATDTVGKPPTTSKSASASKPASLGKPSTTSTPPSAAAADTTPPKKRRGRPRKNSLPESGTPQSVLGNALNDDSGGGADVQTQAGGEADVLLAQAGGGADVQQTQAGGEAGVQQTQYAEGAPPTTTLWCAQLQGTAISSTISSLWTVRPASRYSYFFDYIKLVEGRESDDEAVYNYRGKRLSGVAVAELRRSWDTKYAKAPRANTLGNLRKTVSQRVQVTNSKVMRQACFDMLKDLEAYDVIPAAYRKKYRSDPYGNVVALGAAPRGAICGFQADHIFPWSSPKSSSGPTRKADLEGLGTSGRFEGPWALVVLLGPWALVGLLGPWALVGLLGPWALVGLLGPWALVGLLGPWALVGLLGPWALVGWLGPWALVGLLGPWALVGLLGPWALRDKILDANECGFVDSMQCGLSVDQFLGLIKIRESLTSRTEHAMRALNGSVLGADQDPGQPDKPNRVDQFLGLIKIRDSLTSRTEARRFDFMLENCLCTPYALSTDLLKKLSPGPELWDQLRGSYIAAMQDLMPGMTGLTDLADA